MAQTEQLNIVVSEKGSAGVTKLLKAIATEARTAGAAVKTLRAQVNGKGGSRGSVNEAKGGGKSAAKAHADAVKKSQLAIRKAMIKTANLHSNLHKAEMNRMKARAARVDAVIRSQDSISRLMKKGADDAVREINREEKASMKALNDRVNAYMRSQDEISRLMKKGANDAVREIKREEKASMKALNDRVNAFMRTEDKIESERKQAAAAAHKAVDSLIKDEKKLQALTDKRGNAAARDKLKTQTGKFVRGKAAQEAKAHDAAAGAARRHSKALVQLSGQAKKTGFSLGNLSNQVFFAQRAFATLGGALLVRGYLQMSDAFQNMSNRIRLVTKSTDEYNAVQDRLFQISKNTRQSVVSTVETFIRLRKATESQSVPLERLFGAMETVNKMLALSGRGAVEAEQAMRQLSQAFSKGKLDGDEFRTVSEAMPSVLTALEKSLGKTRGQLRKMSEQGLISTSALLDAFEGVKDQVDKDFAGSVVTLSQSFQLLKDEVFKAIAAFNEESGALEIIQGAMRFLADHIGVVITALKLLFYWMSAKAIHATILWAASINKTLIPALLRATVLVGRLRSPMGILARLATFGASAFAFMTVAVLATGVATYKLARAADEAWDISGKLANVMQDIGSSGFETGPDTAIGFIKKYKEELKDLEKERKRNRKHGVGGPGGSTDREIIELKMKISLHEKWIQMKKDEAAAAEQKIIDDAAFHKAMLAYDKLGIAANKAEKLQITYNEAVWAVGEAHKTGVIEADEMTDALFRLQLQYAKTARTAVQQVSMDVDDVFSDTNEVDKIMKEARAAGLNAKEQRKLGNARLQFVQDVRSGRKQILEKGLITDQKEIEHQAVKFAKKRRQLREFQADQDAMLKEPEKAGKKEIDPNIARAEALKSLIASLNPVTAALNAQEDATVILDEAVEHLGKTQVEMDVIAAQYQASVQNALTPMEAFEQQLTRQAATYGMSTKEAAKYNEALAMQEELLAKLDNNGKGKEDEVAALVARSQAETEAAALNRERLDAIESETAAITSLNDVKAAYDITRQAIIDKEDLTIQERHELNLKNLLKLYPAAAKEIKEIDKGLDGLTDTQKALVRAEDKAKKTIEALTRAWKDGRIKVDAYRNAVKQAKAEVTEIRQTAAAEEVGGGFFSGILLQTTDVAIMQQQRDIITGIYTDLENAAAEAAVGMATAFGRALAGAEDPWRGFAENMKGIFKDMVKSILADLTKLMIKMMIAKAMKAAFGEGGSGGGDSTNYFGQTDSNNSFDGSVGGAGDAVKGMGSAFISAQTGGLVPPVPFRHGGTLNTASLPRFANGGSMQVGGRGGPDSKLVQFMASPGENVNVTNPGQSRMDNKPAPQAAPQVNINNVVDPSQMASAMASPSGKKAILNVIQQDGGTIRRLLG